MVKMDKFDRQRDDLMVVRTRLRNRVVAHWIICGLGVLAALGSVSAKFEQLDWDAYSAMVDKHRLSSETDEDGASGRPEIETSSTTDRMTFACAPAGEQFRRDGQEANGMFRATHKI